VAFDDRAPLAGVRQAIMLGSGGGRAALANIDRKRRC
jgi:hypothetical protein